LAYLKVLRKSGNLVEGLEKTESLQTLKSPLVGKECGMASSELSRMFSK
jgi:hypothetical protein